MYYSDSTLTFIIGCGPSIGQKCIMPWMSAVIYMRYSVKNIVSMVSQTKEKNQYHPYPTGA
jgi:hypothetical protein